MSVYTIPFVAVGGGTPYNNAYSNCISWSPLGASKYLILYRQENPKGLAARVMTYNGPASAPTMGPATLIDSDYSTSVNTSDEPQHSRIYGNASGNGGLVISGNGLNGTTIQFLTVDASDNITAGTRSTLIADIDSGWNSREWMFEPISDTKFFGIWTNLANSSSYEAVLTVDYPSQTFALGTVTGISKTSTPIRCTRIPGSTNSLLCHDSVLREIDGNGGTVRTHTPSGWGFTDLYQIKPVGPDSLIHVQKNDLSIAMRRVENGVPQGNQLVNCTADFSLSAIHTVIPLNKHHAMAVQETATGLYLMTVRLLSDGVGECSTATHKAGGLKLSMGTATNYRWFNNQHNAQPYYHVRDDNTVLYWFISGDNSTSTSRLSYKVLYQAS